MERPLTAADRVPQVGDSLSCPHHPVDRRQVRPVRDVSGVDTFDGKRGLILPRYKGSRYADVVTEEAWGNYHYVSHADGGSVTTEAPERGR